ncbi:hypothetical protein [Aquisalibacillus elongatus]|nr:hypothetical protein [Aquisalibacillus elongatus]
MEIFELARSFDNLSELFLYNEQPHELSKTFFGIANPHAKMSRINGDYRGRPISYNEFEEPLNYLYKKLEDDITKEESELIHEKVKEVADLYYSVTDTDLSEMLTEVSRERLEEKSNQALNILNELVRELEKY